MQQYIGNGKKIQAVQWQRPSSSKNTLAEIEKLAGGQRGLCVCSDGSLCVTTRDVCRYAKPGDYVARVPNGVVLPVPRELFESLFRPAKD